LHDAEFKDVLQNCRDGRTWNKFILNDGFVFCANKLCIPDGSVRLLLLQEAHGGGLMGHFGVKMTEDVLAAHFFWPRMRRDVERFVARYTTCQQAKSGLKTISIILVSEQTEKERKRQIGTGLFFSPMAISSRTESKKKGWTNMD
jgi:hypothetical protein